MSDTTTLCRFQLFYFVYESTFWTENLIVSGYKYTEIKSFYSFVGPCKQMVHTLIHTFNDLWCLKVYISVDKISQFDFPETSIRQETHDPGQYIFGYKQWKERDIRIGRCDYVLRDTYYEICEISMDRVFMSGELLEW